MIVNLKNAKAFDFGIPSDAARSRRRGDRKAIFAALYMLRSGPTRPCSPSYAESVPVPTFGPRMVCWPKRR
jgi:hypothetical protein